jgi:hypothetical protein
MVHIKSNVALSILTVFAFICLGQQTKSHPEVNVIYGDHHIFTIETPEGWINDKQAATTVNLASFFYSKGDSAKKQRSYMYAMGYDKGSSDENLEMFIKEDLNQFRKKYPNLNYEEIEVGKTGEILNAAMYSFDKLGDRYREEVVYMETENSILVFSFAAFSEKDYFAYQPVFDEFVASFNYRGNDPKPSLDWLENQK